MSDRVHRSSAAASVNRSFMIAHSALFKAISEGMRPDEFTAVAVVADTDEPTPPCGACRQILWEFAGDLEIALANLHAETGRHALKDLLPLPFDARLL